MCGRLKQSTRPDKFAELFGIDGPVPEAAPQHDRAPTQAVLAVRRHPRTGRRHLDPLRWGLIPHWMREPPSSPLFNARIEGIAEKRSFRDAWHAARRCLIPADAFYEWKREDRAKIPYAVSRTTGEPLALAGLWDNWRDPASGQWQRSVAVITTAAEAALADIHERMPLMIAPGFWEAWLSPGKVEGLDMRLAIGELAIQPMERGRSEAA